MSDLRYDPIFGQWSCIAERRQKRPLEFQQISQRRAGIDCPFCLGNESVTPPPIKIWPGKQDQPWLIRVLPNKYPALDANLQNKGSGLTKSAMDEFGTDDRPSSSPGFQEVIVLSPRHVVSLSGLNDQELSASFDAFQDRVAKHVQEQAVQHVCLFMNCRQLAGASIEHSHFQLIGSPVCTGQVRKRIERMLETVDDEISTWRRLLDWERDSQIRIVEQSADFMVYCPFASRHSHQIRIAPQFDTPFHQLPAAQREELAGLCRKWVDGLERCLDDPAYNLLFHLPPIDQADAPWFVDLVPRFPQSAGFELATDCWVNTVSPESAASQFRQFDQSLNSNPNF